MDPRQSAHYRAQRQPQQSDRQDNRFSWQIPPDELEGQEGQEGPQGQQLSIDTSFQNMPQQRNITRVRDGRYSEQSPPIELQQASNGQFSPSRPIATMAPSPITPEDPRPQTFATALIQPHGNPSEYLPEKTGGSPYNISPPQQIHPAMFAPIVESPARSPARSTYNPIPQGPHSPLREPASPLPQKSPVSAPSSPGPVPIKRSYDYPENTRQPSVSQPKEPYSPYGMHSPVHAVFSPDAPLGPNGLNPALHQPGQIAHPNMDLSSTGSEKEWKHSLCDCGGDVGTCLTGLFCPCILYGKTSYRLSQKSSKKDPTDMLGYSATNSQCVLMSAACGLWCLFPLIHRTRLRHLYKLTGSITGDIGRACCCCCCVTIQNEREVRDREENTRRWAGPAANAEAYSSPGQMIYAPPPRG